VVVEVGVGCCEAYHQSYGTALFWDGSGEALQALILCQICQLDTITACSISRELGKRLTSQNGIECHYVPICQIPLLHTGSPEYKVGLHIGASKCNTIISKLAIYSKCIIFPVSWNLAIVHLLLSIFSNNNLPCSMHLAIAIVLVRLFINYKQHTGNVTKNS